MRDRPCAPGQAEITPWAMPGMVPRQTLPGRLELPTLRLTASRSNQLSYGSRWLVSKKTAADRDGEVHASCGNAGAGANSEELAPSLIFPHRSQGDTALAAVFVFGAVVCHGPKAIARAKDEQSCCFAGHGQKGKAGCEGWSWLGKAFGMPHVRLQPSPKQGNSPCTISRQ